jgi:hypothetical protein
MIVPSSLVSSKENMSQQVINSGLKNNNLDLTNLESNTADDDLVVARKSMQISTEGERDHYASSISSKYNTSFYRDYYAARHTQDILIDKNKAKIT